MNEVYVTPVFPKSIEEHDKEVQETWRSENKMNEVKIENRTRMYVKDTVKSIYCNDPVEYSSFFITARLNELDASLAYARPYITLNEACRMLDVKEYPDGNVVGWVRPSEMNFCKKGYTGTWVIEEDVTTGKADIRILFQHLESLDIEKLARILEE